MIQAFATSDIGKARQLNEDSYFASKPEDEIQLFIVAVALDVVRSPAPVCALLLEIVAFSIIRLCSGMLKVDS